MNTQSIQPLSSREFTSPITQTASNSIRQAISHKIIPVNMSFQSYLDRLAEWVNDPHERTPKYLKEIAMKRILNFHKSKSESNLLNLSCLELYSIPPLNFEEPIIHELVLSKNKIQQITSLKNTNLFTLHLNQNKISKIENLEYLKNLVHLDT